MVGSNPAGRRTSSTSACLRVESNAANADTLSPLAKIVCVGGGVTVGVGGAFAAAAAAAAASGAIAAGGAGAIAASGAGAVDAGSAALAIVAAVADVDASPPDRSRTGASAGGAVDAGASAGGLAGFSEDIARGARVDARDLTRRACRDLTA